VSRFVMIVPACATLAGCGSVHAGRPSAQRPSAVHTVSNNYNNPKVLAAAIEKILRHRLENKSGPYYVAGVRPTGTVCVPHGVGRDFCVTSLSHGLQNISETAIIAPDGNSFITK
jgi:hypothetical protein